MAKWFRITNTALVSLEEAEKLAKGIRQTKVYRQVRVRARHKMAGPYGNRDLETTYYLEAKRLPDNEPGVPGVIKESMERT